MSRGYFDKNNGGNGGDVMARVGFCGSRSLVCSPLVAPVVGSVLASGRGVAVGCAAGADALVRAAAPGCAVFSVAAFPGLPARAALAARSAALVSAVAASGPGAAFVGFVASGPCPAGLVPARSASRCFAGFGSGSWASLAFAAGLGLPVMVFPSLPGWLPAAWGAWSPAAVSGVWSAAWRLTPPRQAALL